MSYIEEAKIACESCVRNQLKIQNMTDFLPFCKYKRGLSNLLRQKDYLSRNCIFFEHSCRQNMRNCGHYEIPLVLYYVSQECDFHSWFDAQIMFKLSLHNRNSKRIIQDACSLVLLNS
jgi:hypothetical protein